MGGSMSRADLMADLKVSLHDAADIFTTAADADFGRLLDVAALDFGRVRQRLMSATLTLTAQVDAYTAPDDLVAYGYSTWGEAVMPQPWAADWTGPLPRVRLGEQAGARKLIFSPAPTAGQIGLFGSAYPYFYRAAHVVDADATKTSVAAGDRGLLLLRAQAEAMRELAMRNITKPVQMRDGVHSAPRNGTPAALYSVLLDEFERRGT